MTDNITPEAVEEAAFMRWWQDSHDFDYHENGGIYETAARRCFSAGYKALSARVKELEEQNRELALQALASQGQAADAYEAQLAAESKLENAVGALWDVVGDQRGVNNQKTFYWARVTLAKLEAKP